MPRHPRLFLPERVYHVDCRVARGEFVVRMETVAGISLLAIGRYRFRVSDIAALVRTNPNSVTSWLKKGLRLERNNSEFKVRLDHLDAAISEHRLQQHKCGSVNVAPLWHHCTVSCLA